ELNFSTQEIGMKFGIESLIVSKTSKREEETGEVKDREKFGHLRILSPDDIKDVLDILSSEKGSTAVKIHSMYVAKTGKRISVETIQNTLKRCGYKVRIKPRKPAIDEKTRLECLAFAREHIN
ncbi:21474_t:CDS:1, partial [Dentiscutata erythropus]